MGVTKGLAMQRLIALLAAEQGLEAADFDMVLCIGEASLTAVSLDWIGSTGCVSQARVPPHQQLDSGEGMVV